METYQPYRMDSAGKRKHWKSQLAANMEKDARVLASGIRVVGPSGSSNKKQKVRAELTYLTV